MRAAPITARQGVLHDEKQRRRSVLGRRDFEHPLQRNDRHSQQSTDPDCWNVPSPRCFVGSIAAKVEVQATSLGDGQRFGLDVHHGNILSISRIVPLTVGGGYR